ncbi:hypothetical protein N657DRAFT_135825 [Parathielavia appendiculata]|uniref:Uncharacterized protein n=1 Tax=Parathielavia appendiculata TaxID=2587402 RepID=A0AAN6Z0N8_9PEZI|nr:hypothetical protein N657DRAFT_135825 [Parathielavia appendiculata]
MLSSVRLTSQPTPEPITNTPLSRAQTPSFFSITKGIAGKEEKKKSRDKPYDVAEIVHLRTKARDAACTSMPTRQAYYLPRGDMRGNAIRRIPRQKRKRAASQPKPVAIPCHAPPAYALPKPNAYRLRKEGDGKSNDVTPLAQ